MKKKDAQSQKWSWLGTNQVYLANAMEADLIGLCHFNVLFICYWILIFSASK